MTMITDVLYWGQLYRAKCDLVPVALLPVATIDVAMEDLINLTR